MGFLPQRLELCARCSFLVSGIDLRLLLAFHGAQTAVCFGLVRDGRVALAERARNMRPPVHRPFASAASVLTEAEIARPSASRWLPVAGGWRVRPGQGRARRPAQAAACCG
jgi:hypothetical protein